MGGTNTGYLMARLQRVDPDVANKIGKVFRFSRFAMDPISVSPRCRSAAAAAVRVDRAGSDWGGPWPALQLGTRYHNGCRLAGGVTR
jgi:hypothetical protein